VRVRWFKPPVWAASVAAALLVGCGGIEPAAGQTVEPWGKPLVQTTCDDWLESMDRAQRTEMARVLLDLSGKDRPVLPVEVVQFELAITGYCRSPRDDLRAALGDVVDRISSAAAFTYERVTGEPLPSP
jgi:hypothetical protein